MERTAKTERTLANVLALWLAVLALVCTCALAPVAIAAEDDPGGSFLTPFPENDIYEVTVLGDWYADGLLDGFVDAFGTDTRLNIQRKVTRFTGVIRGDFEDRLAQLEQATSGPMHVAVIMTGQEDRVSLRNSEGARIPVASAEWLAEYGRRIDRVMKTLKRKNPGVYWVGLPNLARSEANDQAQKMNDVIRERAFLNGCKYIDVYAGFADEGGGYSAYGPDIEGKIRVLRGNDGISFTQAGNMKLAHFIEKELRRDLNKARANRTVPLLGAEAEQAKINPDNAVKTPSPNSPAATASAAANAAPVVKVTPQAESGAQASSASNSGDQKADNGRVTIKVPGNGGIEETQTIEIVRPAIPASVVALMARRQGSGQGGDLLVDQIPGGLTLMSSITTTGVKARGRSAPTQAPYFRLLVKGERLTPKPGRADDTQWTGGEASSSRARRPGSSG